MSKDLFTHLILKSFQQSLSSEEQNQLDSWLAEDESHRALFVQLKEAWEQSDNYKSDFQIDLDKGWQSIQSKIQAEQVQNHVIPLWRRPVMRIAASVIIILGIGWIALSYFNSTNQSSQFVTVSTSEDEIKKVVLPDGSTVWLNEASKLEYPAKFKSRDIELEGEAHFSVEHDQKHPFTVSAKGTQTTVLGTQFNVSSYSDEQQVKVTLIEGSVSFQSNEYDPQILKPGESVTYDALHAKTVKESSETLNVSSWKSKTLTFDQNAIEDVIADLENYFDQEIKLINNSSVECLFTGTFKEPTFEEILEVMAFTFDLNQSKEANSYQLVINSCQ